MDMRVDMGFQLCIHVCYSSNALAINKKCDIPRKQRICDMCDQNSIEDVLHFVMDCTKFTNILTELLVTLENSLTQDGREI